MLTRKEYKALKKATKGRIDIPFLTQNGYRVIDVSGGEILGDLHAKKFNSSIITQNNQKVLDITNLSSNGGTVAQVNTPNTFLFHQQAPSLSVGESVGLELGYDVARRQSYIKSHNIKTDVPESLTIESSGIFLNPKGKDVTVSGNVKGKNIFQNGNDVVDVSYKAQEVVDSDDTSFITPHKLLQTLDKEAIHKLQIATDDVLLLHGRVGFFKTQKSYNRPFDEKEGYIIANGSSLIFNTNQNNFYIKGSKSQDWVEVQTSKHLSRYGGELPVLSIENTFSQKQKFKQNHEQSSFFEFLDFRSNTVGSVSFKNQQLTLTSEQININGGVNIGNPEMGTMGPGTLNVEELFVQGIPSKYRGAMVYLNPPFVLESGKGMIIPFSNVEHDTSSIFTPQLRGCLQVPEYATKVRLTAGLSWNNDNGCGSRKIIISKNQKFVYPGVAEKQFKNPEETENITLQTAILSVGPGDKFTIFVEQDSGESITLNFAKTWFQMEIVE